MIDPLLATSVGRASWSGQHPQALDVDLDLGTLVSTMSSGDRRIARCCLAALTSPLTDLDQIRHRQRIAEATMRNPAPMRELNRIAACACDGAPGAPAASGRGLRRDAAVLSRLIGHLYALREWADANSNVDDGLGRLPARLRASLDDDFFTRATRIPRAVTGVCDASRSRMRLLPSGHGEPIGVNTASRRGRRRARAHSGVSEVLSTEDESLLVSISTMRQRARRPLQDAVVRSIRGIYALFEALADESALFVGVSTLFSSLTELGIPMCTAEFDDRGVDATDLRDPSLALRVRRRPEANSLAAGACSVVVLTGLNGGGKTTFLRSIGIAQLMAQAGMPVCARRFSTGLFDRVATLFPREDVPGDDGGSFQQELARLAGTVDTLTSRSLLLANEAFGTTEPAIACEIGTDVTRALVRTGVTVMHVTHLIDFAHRLLRADPSGTLSLRASDGHHIRPGPPATDTDAERQWRSAFGTDEVTIG